MSHVALQRVLVRMLYDPQLVERVYQDADAALSGVDLTAEERAHLVRSDRRAWSADPLRRRRSLKALLDEFKASSALAVAATGRLATLDAFFGSEIFHASIQQRGSMALAYADYLQSLPLEPRVAAVAQVERATARCRRGRRPTERPERLVRTHGYVLSSHADALLVPAGTLAAMQAVERVLFEISLAPVAALAEDGPDLQGVPPLGEPEGEAYVVERTGEDSAGLGEASAELVKLLLLARAPVTGERLLQEAVALGAGAEEAAGVVQPLLDDGLLVAAR